MSKLLFIFMFMSSVYGGFFNETKNNDVVEKAKSMENERLCKIFTQKAKTYEKTMRDDMLAKVTLASYKHRASLFCKTKEVEESNSTK